jgi:hypothetical protein
MPRLPGAYIRTSTISSIATSNRTKAPAYFLAKLMPVCNPNQTPSATSYQEQKNIPTQHAATNGIHDTDLFTWRACFLNGGNNRSMM